MKIPESIEFNGKDMQMEAFLKAGFLKGWNEREKHLPSKDELEKMVLNICSKKGPRKYTPLTEALYERLNK